MHIINTSNIEKAKQLIKTAQALIVVQAQDDNFDRKILEYGNFQILLSPESGQRKSTIRNIDSGLNSVLAKIAAKNNISIGINLNEISRLEKKQKAERLVKVKQNIRICRKAKTKLAVITNNKKEASHLLLSLGASTQQIKESIFIG